MQKYTYTGIDASGRRVKGEVSALNEQDVMRQLREADVDVLTLREKHELLSLIKSHKVTNKDIITMTFQIEQLLKSGVPLIDILSDLRESFEGYFRDVLVGLYDSMMNGSTFSQSLARYPDVFDEVYISLVAVGEKTGRLEMVLHDLGMNMRWQDELEARAKKIMVYPSIVFTVVILVVTFLMIFLVPQLVGFIKDMGQELGFLTLSLIAVSDYFVHYWHVTFISIFLSILLFKYAVKKSASFRLKVHRWLLNLNLIGPILFKLKIARMASTMAIMYAAGVSLQEIIAMAGKVVANDYLKVKLVEVEERIIEGSTIADSFKEAHVFPALILKLIKVGETTGRMDEAMRNVSYFYDREAKELIEKLEPAIEPIITMILAVLIGWVMMATLGPVYDVISKIK